MYFHFRSKHALALAVIDEQLARDDVALQELLQRQLSGLETLIDICYLMAVRDLTRDSARAVMHLLPAVGWADGLQTSLFADWIRTLAPVVKRAIAEGDLIAERDPQDVARVLVSMYLGLRQSSDLDEPEQFLLQLEKSWATVLPGLVAPGRLDYFSQFVARRTALAVRTASR